MLAGILGIAGTVLLSEEHCFLRDTPPAGIILFARNVQNREQLRGLTDAIRAAAAPVRPLVLIDQEGGSVMRLRPPVWRGLPPMAKIGRLYHEAPQDATMAARTIGRLIGADLADVGVDVACAPVLDVAAPGLTEAIGTRSFSSDAGATATLGRALADGLLDAGVLPVIKHLPGHGRAVVDSHMGLPVVSASREDLAARDFRPFQALRHLPIGMTAHILFTELDPIFPATISARIVAKVIREEIGFDGLLLSDDLGMSALEGSLADRASRCLAAGCDLALACSGKIEDSLLLAAILPTMSGRTVDRFAQAAALREASRPLLDVAQAEHHLALTKLDA